MSRMTDKLKPCPFCGCEAEWWDTFDEEYPYQIVCKRCFCGTDTTVTKEHAIKSWNTREPMDSDIEIWADVQGYEGKYQVSNHGRVKSLARYRKNNGNSQTFQEERILKQSINNCGYCIVELSLDAKRKRHSVHRLVASAFISNDDGKEQVNHKDENKQNNHVDNLEWCSCKENNNYGSHNEKSAKTRGIAVVRIDESGNREEFYSISEAARRTGISQPSISECLKKSGKSGGYYWRNKGVQNE